MICINCSGKLDTSMRHAMLSNLCPFCGKNIFTSAEADFRKSIYRILLKNGIENDELISNLLNDISNALRKDIPIEDTMAKPKNVTAIRQPMGGHHTDAGQELEDARSEQEEMIVGEDEDDSELPPEMRNAPSRSLSPDPRRSSIAAPAPTNSSKVDMAMRAFEDLEKNENDDSSGNEEISDGNEGADELERSFLKSAGVDPATILQQKVGGVPKRPGGFKNVPVRRTS